MALNDDLKAARVRRAEVEAVVDEDKLNPDDLAERKQYIRASRLNGAPVSSAIQFMPEAPLSSAVFPLLQQIDQMKENRTGVTRYNQGNDSKDLNKTATGITAIMSAANQRIEMIARMFSETGVVDLFRLLVEMNQRYIDNEQVVRLTNGKQLTIRPDDLKGEFDLDVAAGVGAGQRQEATQNMMMLLGQIYPALKNLGVESTPGKVLEAAKTLVSQMGYKDTAKYIPTPEELQASMQQQAMMMMQQQQMQAQKEQTDKATDLESKLILQAAKGAK